MSKCAATIQAAGRSSRMGCCKQLLPLAGRTVIEHILENVSNGDVDKIIVVTGLYTAKIKAAIKEFSAQVVENPDHDSDMAGSVRIALSVIPDDHQSILICLGDQPLITAECCRNLLQQHRSTPERIIIPTFQGRKGHPTLFPRRLLNSIMEGGTLRDVINKNQALVTTVETENQWVIMDMDTPEDYQEIQRYFEMREGSVNSSRVNTTGS